MTTSYMTWLVPSVIVVFVALLAGNYYDDDNSSPSSSPVMKKAKTVESKITVYVIGDLHGDVHCAKHWVNRTGLIKERQEGGGGGENGQWIDDDSYLVFLGDYVDKGPTSRQTLQFVKSLTDQFPHHVTALMGNHEMELLLDRDTRRHEVWGGAAYYQMAWSSVHPGEYKNYLSKTDVDDSDDFVIELLYNASLEVYGYQQERNVVFQPTIKPSGNRGSILSYVPLEHRSLVQERLALYQKRYIDAFRSGTELGDWLEQRPAVAQISDSLFVHGGISPRAAQIITNGNNYNNKNSLNANDETTTDNGIEKINQSLLQNSHEDKLLDFIQGTMQGKVVYEMLVFRGNHNQKACSYLPQLLPEGISRLGVGHTPGDSIRLLCDGNFLALDSALGRWFRNSGNDYCYGDRLQVSQNRQYKCNQMNDVCEGQIVKIDPLGKIHLIR